ncbi:MAG: endopeptidase La [Lachnospiraceae bacterium]|nr:endopeptidase La [Lachnospiraceae bacterium]
MSNVEMTDWMPAIPLRGMVVLPGTIAHIDLNRKKSITALERATKGGNRLFLVCQKQMDIEEPGINDLQEMGCIARVKQVITLPNKVLRVLVQGESRGRLLQLDEEQEKYLLSEVEIQFLQRGTWEGAEEEARVRILKERMQEYLLYQPNVPKIVSITAVESKNLSELMQVCMNHLNFSYQVRQEFLDDFEEEKLFELVMERLAEEVDVQRIRQDLNGKLKQQVNKHQKDYMLREQMHMIKKELGEDDTVSDADSFAEGLKKIDADDAIKEKIQKEINRFKTVNGSSSESAVQRAYIETLLELPWNKSSKDNADIHRAEKILNRDHYGLTQVKERILEFLAVRTLTSEGESPIVCLVGPPGTGKTSIARSVAESLEKEYVRICLGGVRDEAEIRGHRRTYVGAMPGRIATALKNAGVNNPLILLDEIDKLSNDYKGDPSSALLEVLDSKQNQAFRDHYVEIPLDLSKVLFLATANSISDIPRPLLDRMEIIELNSYTVQEKFHIAKEHLWGRALKNNGLTRKNLSITPQGLTDLILLYTREAGVRELERKIGELCRKVAKLIVKGEKTTVRVTEKNLEQFLGKPKFRPDEKNDKDEIGIVRGLAWTAVGGDTLQIEVNVMPGKGVVELTGRLGEVMKESAAAGISYIRSVASDYKINPDFFKKKDIHIHIPEGAVPKDGPSAGITMATAVLSAIAEIPVYANLAMTGEITLRGRVLPIGGVKEKILAAKMAGITKVIVPKENERDVLRLEAEITDGMEVVYAETMDDVLKTAFTKSIEKGKKTGENKKR